MDENAKAGDLQEQAAGTGLPCESGDWPGPLTEPCELAPDELDLLQRHVPGHRWDGWRRLAGDEDYFAACSCGWRSTETGQVSSMLRQVKDHLDAVWQSRGARLSTQAPARDKRGRDASQDEILALHERAREVRASVQGQQMRLSQSLRHSTELLSASADQADQLVAALERGDWATGGATAQNAEDVRHKVQRARELRKAIAVAAAALAVMAEDIAWIHRDPETPHSAGSAGHQRLVGVASETAGTAREETAGTVSGAGPTFSDLSRAQKASGHRRGRTHQRHMRLRSLRRRLKHRRVFQDPMAVRAEGPALGGTNAPDSAGAGGLQSRRLPSRSLAASCSPGLAGEGSARRQQPGADGSAQAAWRYGPGRCGISPERRCAGAGEVAVGLEQRRGCGAGPACAGFCVR